MLLSLVTPTHDTRWLLQTWKSIESQRLPLDVDWEWVVVVNDKDGSLAHCENLARSVRHITGGDIRVRIEINPTVWKGIGERKLDAFKRARGEILIELDHDDLLTPDALSEIALGFVDPDVGFVYSDWVDFSEDGSDVTYQIGENNWASSGFKFYDAEISGVRPGKYRAVRSFDPTAMSISTVYWAPNHVRAWRKSVYDSLGGHDPTLKICDDHDLVCRTYLATKLHHIPKPLYLYRVSGRNTWLANQSEISGTTLMLRDKYLERLVLRDCQLRGLKALDLGSERGQRRPGWTTVDIEASPDVDVVADLTLSWPFETGSIGAIRAHDFIEHLPDKMHTMSEVWRCLRPGGWFLSMTPSTDGRGAFQDPTHVSYWNSNAFWYWTRPEQASFIRNDRKLFKEIFLGEVFPSAWHQQHKIPYVRADLLALKQGFEDAGHWPIPPESSSMLGKWDGWYSNLKKTPSAYRYGDTITYRLAANFMQDCTSIEDWGCGAGGLRRFCDPESYVGVDGSQNPHVDVVDDLRTRRSKPQGIVLRHVLEHNYDWRSVLTSAMASATEKVCVVLFTGFVDQTREIDHNRHAGVDAPTLAFSKADIEAFFTGCEFELLENLKTGAGYGVESVYYVWKKGRPRNLSGRKRAVYTAICGDYDLPKKVPVIEGVDFVLFTDREIEAEGWIAKHIPRTSGDPRMIAKQYKLLPHQYLSDYDETVWIDGSFEPTERLAEAFEYLAECPVAFFLHPDRWCIYDEVEASIKMSKYDAEQLRKQAAQYRQTGHPEKFGLYAGGVIARDNRSKTAMELNERWLRECETGSPQDQISLPVVLRSLGLSPFAFRGALWDNTWGSWKSHV